MLPEQINLVAPYCLILLPPLNKVFPSNMGRLSSSSLSNQVLPHPHHPLRYCYIVPSLLELFSSILTRDRPVRKASYYPQFIIFNSNKTCLQKKNLIINSFNLTSRAALGVMATLFSGSRFSSSEDSNYLCHVSRVMCPCLLSCTAPRPRPQSRCSQHTASAS